MGGTLGQANHQETSQGGSRTGGNRPAERRSSPIAYVNPRGERGAARGRSESVSLVYLAALGGIHRSTLRN